MTSDSVSVKSLMVLLICINLLGSSVKADEVDPDCHYLSNIIGVVQKQVGQLSTCATEGNFGTAALRSANYMCIVKCALNKVGLLDPTGMIDKAGATALLESSVPPTVKDKLSETMGKCKEAAEKIDPNDASCKTYEPVVTCALKTTTSTLRTSALDLIKSGKISPSKLAKCTALGARVEAELMKLDLQSLRTTLMA